MDLELLKKSVLDYTQKRKRWISILVGVGFSSYAVYKVYNLPSIAQKRQKISKLLGALVSVAEVISDSADTIGVISKDFRDFIQSDSDQIPNSFKQISKLTRFSEFSDSVISLTQALTLGILRGCNDSNANSNSDNSSFLDSVFDKLATPAGSGFVSVVVGSFARNLVMGFYQDESSRRGMNSNSEFGIGGENDNVGQLVDVVCSSKCKELIGDCVQLFVSTAVAVYLDKTMHINTYDEIFAGLTNPKHEKKVTDVLVTVCNGAIQTLVKTSHDVLTNVDSDQLNSRFDSSVSAFDEDDAVVEKQPSEEEEVYSEPKRRKSFDEVDDGGWVDKVSSTLAVPSNRRLVLDLTGRITFETVRSFLEFLVEKLYGGIRRCIDVVHEAIVDGGLGIYRYVTAKSSLIVTVCLSFWLHILDGAWVTVPA